MHLLHDGIGCEIQSVASHSEFNHSKVGESDDAGQDMAPDFSIRPMTDRKEGNQVVVLGLPKCFFHYVSIQAGSYNLIRTPIHVIRYDDVLSESIDVPSNPIEVFAKPHAGSPLIHFKGQIIEIVGEMQLLAAVQVALPDLLGIFSSGAPAP